MRKTNLCQTIKASFPRFSQNTPFKSINLVMTIDPRQNTFDEIDGNKDLLEDYNQKACENFLILRHKINDKK